METLTLKVRILSLWLFAAVAIAAHGQLAFMEPGIISGLNSGETTPGAAMLLFMSLFYWVPLLMAFLSVTLRDDRNRRANMILGAVFVVLNAVHLVEHFAEPSAHQFLLIGSTVVAPALIFWYAFKWHPAKA